MKSTSSWHKWYPNIFPRLILSVLSHEIELCVCFIIVDEYSRADFCILWLAENLLFHSWKRKYRCGHEVSQVIIYLHEITINILINISSCPNFRSMCILQICVHVLLDRSTCNNSDGWLTFPILSYVYFYKKKDFWDKDVENRAILDGTISKIIKYDLEENFISK